MKTLKLIIVSGLPGSGKSTLAEAVAKKLGYPIFSVDPIESAILKSGIKRSFETGLAAYLVAETLASEQFKLGNSVVVDAVSSVKEGKDIWRELSKKFNAKLIIVECELDEEIHKKRIMSRVRNLYGIPEVTWNEVETRRKEYADWEEERLLVDSKNSVETNINKAVGYIEKRT